MRLRSARTSVVAILVLLCSLAGLPKPVRAGVFLGNVYNDLDTFYSEVLDIIPRGFSRVRIGLGPAMDPHFVGDSAEYFHVLPLISFRYGNLLEVDNNVLRINFLGHWGNIAGENSPWSFGPTLRLDNGRYEDYSPKLKGLGDVSTSIEAGAYLGYTAGRWRYRLRLRQDVADGHDGFLADIQAITTLAQGRNWSLSGNAQLTWANKKYMKSFYGVTPEQSFYSGLPVYNAHAGIHDVTLDLVGNYTLNRHWSALASLGLSRLFSSAANCPLVSLRGSPNQVSAATFVVYSF